MTDLWAGFWHKAENHRWSAVDEHVLHEVARAMGWGPERWLLELGGGRGEHSKRLAEMGRCVAPPIIYDTSKDANLLAERRGCEAVPAMAIPGHCAVVWSYGLVEHFDADDRERMVRNHFVLATEMVVIVVPARTWTRKLSPPRPEVPWQRELTAGELLAEMTLAAVQDGRSWRVEKPRAFAPLFGLRHIPDAVYEVLTPFAERVLPGNLLIGVARRV